MSVTWHTVRRWFTALDIATMRELGYPLDDYEFVSRNASYLLKRLADGSMPPQPFKRWSQEQIDGFQAWIDAGCPERVDKKNVPRKVQEFIVLSEVFTGFDDLANDPDQAAKNLESMHAWIVAYSFQPIEFGSDGRKYGDLDKEFAELLHGWHKITEDPDKMKDVKSELEGFAQQQLRKRERKDSVGVIKAIIRLWYTGSLPTTNPFAPPLSVNQWPDGLMWRAAQAHPPGYSTEGSYRFDDLDLPDEVKPTEGKELYGHWTAEPQDDGKFTGLGDTATHFKTKGT